MRPGTGQVPGPGRQKRPAPDAASSQSQRWGLARWISLALVLPAAFYAAWNLGQAARQALPPEEGAAPALPEGKQSAALRQDLAREPLDAGALRQLALGDGIEQAQGLRLLKLADQVSRRDAETQLYLLEFAAQAGNIQESLRHYDALLSVQAPTGPVLLGILARGLGDPALRAALLPYAGRGWFGVLIRQGAGQGGDPRNALALAREAGWLATPDRRDALAPALIPALLTRGADAEAAALADSLGMEGWRRLGFAIETLDPRLGPLGWRIEASGVGAAQWRSPDVLEISVEPLRSLTVARRETLYGPGAYRLDFTLSAADGQSPALEWSLDCPGSRPAEVIGTAGADAGLPRRVSMAVTIPADCPRQLWALRAIGGDASGYLSAEISGMGLWRQGAAVIDARLTGRAAAPSRMAGMGDRNGGE